MLTISRKGAALRASIIGTVVVAVVTMLGLFVIDKSNTEVNATDSGDTVYISPQGEVFYDHWSTNFFTVSSEGHSYRGYCAQPSLDTPSGSYSAHVAGNSMKYNKIKLIMYINENNNSYTADARNEIFNYWGADGEERYAYTHAIIGAIYANDYKGLTEADVDWVNRMENKLEGYINNDADVWAVAKTYTLYYTVGGGGTQDIVWIEGPHLKHGSIKAKKCDSATQACTAQGNANFNGIQFSIYNNSGSKLWIDTKNDIYSNGELIETVTVNSNGEATFSGLTGGTYLVKETTTNTTYQLTADDQTATISIDGQTITLSFYNDVSTGKVTVNKTDAHSGTCTTVGDASFTGVTFSITNNSTNPIYYNGRTVARGAVVDTKQLNTSNCKVVFDNLPYGSYTVKETAAGVGYNLNTTTKNVTIPTNNSDDISVDYSNAPILGKITVNKTDKDTGTCTNTSELSFAGTTITITNSSAHPIYYNGHAVAKNAVIDTRTFTDGQCNTVFENLPYGTYTIKETHAGTGYALDTTAHTVTIPTNNSTNVSTKIENQPIRGDVKFVKKDAANNKVMPNVVFSISALDKDKNVKETHIVVTDKNGVVNTASSFAQHTKNTNGYDDLYDGVDPIVFSGYGTWFGLDKNNRSITPRNEVGALPYGTYIIQELRCGANLFCTGILNQKTTITIDQANEVINLGNWDNACANFSLGTTATDAKDGDKYIELDKQVTIKDNIEYCVKPNLEYTIKGILMDKSTGEPLLIDDKTVENSVTIKPTEECGTIDMDFTIDASKLGGKEVVVFESLYYDKDLITSHDDLNNADQTVSIISMHTYATNKASQQKSLPLDEYVEINDTVTYCLVPGQEYTIKGVLMNKHTNSQVYFEGQPVTSELTFTPEKACGEVDMLYRLNTTGLAGAELVIFESLYQNDQLALEHKDFGNTDETVTVEVPKPIPAPETGHISKESSGGIDTNYIFFAAGAVVLATGGYLVYRVIARKQFLKKW